MRKIDVVGAVIKNSEDDILCALRSKNMTLPGVWEFPGGKMEPGETPVDTIVREIKEELGCEIEVGDFISDDVYEYSNVIVRLITYYATIISGTPLAKEHEKIEWIKKENLHDLVWAPADIPTVDKLFTRGS